MSVKKFGARDIFLTGSSGISSITSSNVLEINAQSVGINTNISSDLKIGTGGTVAIFDISTGNVGINSTQPKGKLDVAGQVNIPTTLEPVVNTTGAVEFDGSGDYLSILDNTDFEFGSGDFTIEGWVYRNTTGQAHCIASKWSFSGASAQEFILRIESNNRLRATISNGTSAFTYESNQDLSADTWYHVAVVKNGTTLKIYIDGSETHNGNFTGTIPSTSNNLLIGSVTASQAFFDGKISNFRIVKGTAVYTSNFTVPTPDLDVIAGTSILCCQSSSDADQEATDKSISVNGNATATTGFSYTEYLNVEHNLNVSGITTTKDLNVTGVSTFNSNVDINADVDISGNAGIGSLNVTGVSTFNDTVTFNPDGLLVGTISSTTQRFGKKAESVELESTNVNAVFSNNNLTLTSSDTSGSTREGALSSLAATSGKIYTEITIDAVDTASFISYGIVGVSSISPLGAFNYDGYFGNETSTNAEDSIGMRGNNDFIRFNGTTLNGATGSGIGTDIVQGDVMGLLLDLDANQLAFSYNGFVGNFVDISPYDDPLGFKIGASVVTNTQQVTLNFGETPFTYTPPAGYVGLYNKTPYIEVDNSGLDFVGVSTFTDTAIFDSTGSIQIPVGTTAERLGIAVTGQIRYNTDNTTFEGYGPGGEWNTLGGVKDVDGDTYIVAETSPGADEDQLYLYAGGALAGTISSTNTILPNITAVDADKNIFIGENVASGYSDTQDACFNVFIGNDISNTTLGDGSNNVAIGRIAGNKIQNGDNNIFIGCRTGRDTNSGCDNIFFGRYTGASNTSGSYNLAFGFRAGSGSNTADNNIFLGTYAGRYNTSSNNIAIGECASRADASPFNIAIGSSAGCSNTGCCNVIIGNLAKEQGVGGNRNVYIGERSGRTATGSENVFLGSGAGENSIANGTVAIGQDAGRTDASGAVSNTFVGKKSGQTATGSNNVFVGLYAGSSSSGGRNVAIGAHAGRDIDGDYNIFLGDYTGRCATNASDNVVLGCDAGCYITTGSRNVFLGKAAGKGDSNFITGEDNISIGSSSGDLLQSGSYNIFLGRNAGNTVTTGSCNIIIGNNVQPSSATGDSQLAIGVGATHWIDGDSNFNIGIGTTNPSGAADTNNTTILNAGIVTANFYYGDGSNITNVTTAGVSSESLLLKTDADFNLWGGEERNYDPSTNSACYNVSIGYSAGCSLSTGDDNIFLGYSAGFNNNSGINNTFLGHCAGGRNAGGNNNFIAGFCAGYCGLNHSANILIGQFAGFKNAGYNNIFLGDQAGMCNTGTGTNASDNIFLGNCAGYRNVTGSHNIALGEDSGRSNETSFRNVTIGLNAGCKNFAQENVFIGIGAGRNKTNGSANTFLGTCAGFDFSSGGCNVLIGYNVEPPNSTGDFQFAVGANDNHWIDGDSNFNIGLGTGIPAAKLDVVGNAVVSDSIGIGKTIPIAKLDVVGNAIVSDSIGIGTTNPLTKLHIEDANTGDVTLRIGRNGYVQTDLIASTGAGNNDFKITQNGFDRILLEYGGNSAVHIDSNGNVGIASTTPTTKLDVIGNVFVSDSIGIGTTNPTTKLDVVGNAIVSDSIGIATDSPTQKLDVNGAARFRGAIYDNNNVVGTANSVLISTGAGVSWSSSTILPAGDADKLDGLDSLDFLRSNIDDIKTGITTFEGDVYFGADLHLTDGSGGYELIDVEADDVLVNGKHIHSAFGVWVNSATAAAGGRNTGINASGSNLDLYSNSTAQVRIVSDGQVCIGGTDPEAKLDVRGNIIVNETTLTGVAIASTDTLFQVGIHTLSASVYRSVEYTIQATNGSNFHATKILALHNGSTAYHSEYGTIFNNSSVAAFDVDISGGNIRLLSTNANASNTDYVINFIATKV